MVSDDSRIAYCALERDLLGTMVREWFAGVVAAVGRAVAVVGLWTQEMGEGHSVRADEMSARRL